MGRDAHGDPDEVLSVTRVADELRVARPTIHNWFDRGWIGSDKRSGRERVITRAEMRAAKVLKRDDVVRRMLLERGLPRSEVESGRIAEALERAASAGKIAPVARGRAGADLRYSLDDIDACFASTERSGGDEPRRDRHAAIDHYLRADQRPCDLPRWFWETNECPEFVAPLGVQKVTFGDVVVLDGVEHTEVHSTACWCRGGLDGLDLIVANVGYILGRRVKGSAPFDLERANNAYDVALAEWRAEWERWRRPL